MALNVNRNVYDPFYRYKMPPIVAKLEGKGNGVKTVVANVTDVARALARPPTYVTKYFGCELGAQTQFDLKNERYIVNGSHEAPKLQDMLDGFIKKFVLCEQCENPETVITIAGSKRGAVLRSSCKACGHAFILDMTHKLTTFILKNPPEGVVASQAVPTKGKNKNRAAKKGGEAADTNGDEHGEGGTANGTGDKKVDSQIDDYDVDENDWAEDVSEEAVKARMAQLSSGVKGLALDADLDKTEAERINIFYAFVRHLIENGGLAGQDKVILAEAERLEVVTKAPLVLCELLLDVKKLESSDKNIVLATVATLKSNKRMFLRFTAKNNTKAQKYLLCGLEKVIEADASATLLAKSAVIFKAVYDEDLVDEEVLLDWHKKASKKYVSKALSEQIRKKAQPFITWLQEAEEETSDDGNEEEEFELEYDERAKIASIKEDTKNDEGGNKGAVVKDEDNDVNNNIDDDDDDLNIDDI